METAYVRFLSHWSTAEINFRNEDIHTTDREEDTIDHMDAYQSHL
jgi:hypothetical protein